MEEFGISQASAKKYIDMMQEDISSLDNPINYKKRKTQMDNHINIIFRMLRDGVADDLIYFYVLRKGYMGKTSALKDYIYCIEKNNFPARTPMNLNKLIEWRYPEDIIIIKRNNLLKYLVTENPKAKKDETIAAHIGIIKEKHPIVEKVQSMFHIFHTIIMGANPDDMDVFLSQYKDSEIASFCVGIKKDIVSVKNAISFEVSSGFVEGNNNKFKLIKRIVYGRWECFNFSVIGFSQ